MTVKENPCWKLTINELQNFSKEELITRFIRLQDHNVQLKNIIAKLQSGSCTKDSHRGRPFDFSKFPKQHILIRLLYCGWDYQGYAVVEGTNQTIEHHVIQALLKCRLIESRESANYSRCGRTDKGVSSFMQVVSVTVRASKEGTAELDYCGMLNRVLPPDIRATGYCQVADGFSARFDCNQRHYKYFFPKANLNIQAMNEGAKNLIGCHDFRNFCKMDVDNGVVNFEREILSASISPVSSSDSNGYTMMVFDLIGKSFLWHQVRYIMAVLFLIGEELESPGIVTELLNVQEHPKKPQYQMAHSIGLCLFGTSFDGVNWIVSQEELKLIIAQMQSLWTISAIKTIHIREMLKFFEGPGDVSVTCQANVLLKRDSRRHKPLLSRNTCLSLEEKIEHCHKKLKADPAEGVT